MGWTQIEYIDVDAAVPMTVTKQVWNGKEFVTVVMQRHQGVLTTEQKVWLLENFGQRGPRWDYSITGNFWVMDEQVYTWYKLKWGNK